ncbi:MAG TPA: PASTA domain-containing protein [Catalimonadaceae bacterium]|nr:PASTA domain-containing protein [Catalimonadaceae bacterium]
MAFKFFKAESRRDIFLHFLMVVLTAAILVVGFFNVYLPYTTNHGQTITVPNLKGIHMNQLDGFLGERDLEYQIDDSVFVPGAQPFLVTQQFPPAGAKVKQNRKIYLTIQAKNPPMVKMPNLKNRSFNNAQRELESFGLLLGEIKYVPDLQLNAVLSQLVGGKEIAEGQWIAKGTKIDLVVGDGLSNRELDVPDLKGMPLDEAKDLLNGSGLQPGSIIFEAKSDLPDQTIFKQKPEPGTKIREGDVVDIWVVGGSTETP